MGLNFPGGGGGDKPSPSCVRIYTKGENKNQFMNEVCPVLFKLAIQYAVLRVDTGSLLFCVLLIGLCNSNYLWGRLYRISSRSEDC